MASSRGGNWTQSIRHRGDRGLFSSETYKSAAGSVSRDEPVSDGCNNEGWCAALYEASAARLILYGRTLGLSHSEAEDVLHEVFASLLTLATIPETPGHYLVRAVRNRALNYRRSFLRRLTREFESTRWFETSPGETPAERAAMRCLQQLPPEQREVIVLKIWHGHTFDEIAGLLDLSPNTAAGRYRYGMNKLRSCLREVDPSEVHELDRSLGTSTVLLDPA